MTEFSTISCSYFPLCSGCQLQDQVTTPPIWRDVEQFFQSLHNPITLEYGSLTGWRVRSKLAVRGTYLKPEIGLFKQGTHEVVSIPDCPLHHLSIQDAYEKVLQWIKEYKIDPFDEEKVTGALRYLQFVVERRNRRVQLTLVLNRKGRDPLIEKNTKYLYESGGFGGIWINLQPGSTNKVLGSQWLLAEGEPYVWEKIGEVEVCFHPACFGQAHLELFERMLQSIKSSLLPDKRVVEFYAGVGVIGLNCASKSRQVICTEINPFALECFHLSRLKLPSFLHGKVEFVLKDAQQACHLLEGAEVAIVDPPRKGLDTALLNSLCQSLHLEQIIYISCGFYSFQRDCEQLLAHGWEVEKAEGYLLFPGSNHVEILCILRRKGKI